MQPTSADFAAAVANVDRVLHRVTPSVLATDQRTQFVLVLNLKTAKAMGIKFPQSILVRADRVIE